MNGGFSATLSFVFTGSVIGTGSFDQPVLLYADAGDQVEAFLVGASGAFGGAFVLLTGYMLDCTIAPCAAIAH
jgi:hypothetical protein